MANTAITIERYSPEAQLLQRHETTTGAKAEFRVGRLPQGQFHFKLSVSAGDRYFLPQLQDYANCTPGCPFASTTPHLLRSFGSPEFYKLKQQAGLIGSVTSASSGEPLDQLYVVIVSDAFAEPREKLVSSGSFEFTELPADVPLRLYTKNKHGWINQRWPAEACIDADCAEGAAFELGWDGVSQHDFALSQGLFIRGAIVSAFDSRGLPGCVEFADSSGNLVARVPTYSTGTYQTQGLPEGVYHARAQHQEGEHLCVLFGGLACDVDGFPRPITDSSTIQVGPNSAWDRYFPLLEQRVLADGFETIPWSPAKDYCASLR